MAVIEIEITVSHYHLNNKDRAVENKKVFKKKLLKQLNKHLESAYLAQSRFDFKSYLKKKQSRMELIELNLLLGIAIKISL